MNETELVHQINKLKVQREAIIVAHNYQLPEVQDAADFVGDSLELSKIAARTEAKVIVFCGVHFMAETASILSPDKKVLLPDADAGCPMANMITADRLRQRKLKLPGYGVVCYVNSSAAVKAESDVCCTSANAVSIVERMPQQQILFVPDQYLGHYVSTKVSKEIVVWDGYCPTHAKIQLEDIARLKLQYPGAVVMVHPECRPEVIDAADEVLSTGGMLRFARSSPAAEIIVGTEIGILHRLQKDSPDKKFIPVSDKAVCPNMKKITLEKILTALENMAPEVTIPEPVRSRARQALQPMLD